MGENVPSMRMPPEKFLSQDEAHGAGEGKGSFFREAQKEGDWTEGRKKGTSRSNLHPRKALGLFTPPFSHSGSKATQESLLERARERNWKFP